MATATEPLQQDHEDEGTHKNLIMTLFGSTNGTSDRIIQVKVEDLVGRTASICFVPHAKLLNMVLALTPSRPGPRQRRISDPEPED
jgi:hypothetical protein